MTEYRPLSVVDLAELRQEVFHNLQRQSANQMPNVHTLEHWYNHISDTTEQRYQAETGVYQFLLQVATPITLLLLRQRYQSYGACAHTLCALQQPQSLQRQEVLRNQFFVSVSLIGRDHFQSAGYDPDQFVEPALIVLAADIVDISRIPATPVG